MEGNQIDVCVCLIGRHSGVIEIHQVAENAMTFETHIENEVISPRYLFSSYEYTLYSKQSTKQCRRLELPGRYLPPNGSVPSDFA